MRDFERLEELSTTVEAGLRSNEVIWAIDRALAGEEIEQSERESLIGGSEILKGIGEPQAAGEEIPERRTQSMLGGEAVASLRSAVLLTAEGEEGDDRARVIATELATALESVGAGESADTHRDALETALTVFSRISEMKLGRANGIVRTRRDRTLWLSRTTTSSLL